MYDCIPCIDDLLLIRSHHHCFQSQPAPKSSSASTAGTTAPLLVVPTDQTKWATMQKDLVEGGVYHVELPTKERKYFLWDGVRLVPCKYQASN